MKKAIVTLAIGAKYQGKWEKLCQANWERYASKHGYDLICVTEPLDDSARAASRSSSWQKCLILRDGLTASYDQVVWLDSDILINVENAPSIVENVSPERIGCVDLWSAPTPAAFQTGADRVYRYWGIENDPCAFNYYTEWGLPGGFNQVITASVMVLSPRHHRALLEHVYHTYEDRGESCWHYEMRPLSYELLKADVVTWLDCRFSTSWSIQMGLHYPFLLKPGEASGERAQLVRRCLNTTFQNSYFLHFGPWKGAMNLVDSELTADEMFKRDDFYPKDECVAPRPEPQKLQTPPPPSVPFQTSRGERILDFLLRRSRPAISQPQRKS